MINARCVIVVYVVMTLTATRDVINVIILVYVTHVTVSKTQNARVVRNVKIYWVTVILVNVPIHPVSRTVRNVRTVINVKIVISVHIVKCVRGVIRISYALTQPLSVVNVISVLIVIQVRLSVLSVNRMIVRIVMFVGIVIYRSVLRSVIRMMRSLRNVVDVSWKDALIVMNVIHVIYAKINVKVKSQMKKKMNYVMNVKIKIVVIVRNVIDVINASLNVIKRRKKRRVMNVKSVD